jgi:hypothetical protein
MAHEQFDQPAPQEPGDLFGFTKGEKLDWRVSQERFQSILEDEQTIIHRVEDSENKYGEFLFVTASRPGLDDRVAMFVIVLPANESQHIQPIGAAG